MDVAEDDVTPEEFARLIEGWKEAPRQYKEEVLEALRQGSRRLVRECSKCGHRPAMIHRFSPGKFHYIWKCLDIRFLDPDDLFCEKCGIIAVLGDQ